jgi:hypothetical protein
MFRWYSLALQQVYCFVPCFISANLAAFNQGDDDVAVGLNVLAVWAVFVFVGAVLLGAF